MHNGRPGKYMCLTISTNFVYIGFMFIRINKIVFKGNATNQTCDTVVQCLVYFCMKEATLQNVLSSILYGLWN